MTTHEPEDREKMNAHFKHVMSGLLLNAERDVRLARADHQPADLAIARARLHTLQAALEIYAASHKTAYGVRPWPRPQEQA